MTGSFEPVFRFLLHLGGWGLFSLGIVDAILFTPLANDILLVALVSAHHDRAIYYAGMAAAGSVIGCAILDALSRKGGEAGLEKAMSKERIDWVKKKITTRAGWAVALACIMPPPFPFTPVIAGAAALQYPRVKLLSIVAAVRVVRFGALAYLASRYGKHIVKIADLPAVRWSVIGLIVLSIAGSAWTIWSKWKKRK